MAEDRQAEIARYDRVYGKIQGNRELRQNGQLLYELESRRYEIYYEQIHGWLAGRQTEQSEGEIREHVRFVIQNDLVLCGNMARLYLNRAQDFKRKKKDDEMSANFEEYGKWNALYEGFYAIAAFRSLEHFAIFMEWDKAPSDKMWEYSIDTFKDGGFSGCTKGFFHYMTSAIMQRKPTYIEKQLPTAYGKSYSDSMAISFILGYNKNEQIIKVVGNNSLPSKCTMQVVNIMTNKRYRQVFPEYAKLCDSEKNVKDQIFSVCKIQDGMLTVRGSSKDTNYECFSKGCDRDGIRCSYLFMDDVTQRSEILKLDMHKSDITAFDGTWKRRAENESRLIIVNSGTTYDAYDILSVLKFRYSDGMLYKSSINKWTYTNKDKTAAFICVPKLDDKGRLTFPQKCVLKNVLADKRNNYELFMAMDMQQPIIPKEYSFYWDYLQQYDYVPSDCSEYAVAALDPARTGSNYVSMPIFRKRKEIDNESQTEIDKFYLVDCLYEKITMDEAYGKIVNLVEKHHITKLHIERNTDTSLKYLLAKIMAERGITYCEISEVYSTKKKEDRIYADETVIKKHIVFPKKDMFELASQMGTFMNHIISYKYKGAEYDDSIDSVGLFCDRFVLKQQQLMRPKIISL